jgi:hypothetical protein
VCVGFPAVTVGVQEMDVVCWAVPPVRDHRCPVDRFPGGGECPELGGFEELREFRPSWRNSAISPLTTANSPRSPSITASRCADTSSTTAGCPHSYASCSRSSTTAAGSSDTPPSSTSPAQDHTPHRGASDQLPETNDRPRKIHHWKKASEIFTELVETNASTG